ncbi:pilus assembly FimT family protein [Sporohalobacter salinus]|uniref:pilus assembly FimT family protein n=1 Tax=Sporohalobacter salinus TaxID=1494606 RepID=UPI0019613D19|nr:type II secretion system protein [Sporohalobacter salinus]MBM7622734.1 Tfp pilus assembly protein FimT [Sporohalobacter salinus]
MNILEEERSFILIELLIVVSIFGVLVGMFTFGMRDIIGYYRLKAQVGEIVSMLNKAKYWSINKQEKYGVKFNLGNDTYTLFRYNDGNEFETKDSNQGIDIYVSDRVHFTPEGTADYGEVKLKNDNEEKYRIYVYSVTGRISVEKWDKKKRKFVDKLDY